PPSCSAGPVREPLRRRAVPRQRAVRRSAPPSSSSQGPSVAPVWLSSSSSYLSDRRRAGARRRLERLSPDGRIPPFVGTSEPGRSATAGQELSCRQQEWWAWRRSGTELSAVGVVGLGCG